MAETIHVAGEGGSVFAMDLPLPESIAQRLTTGQLRRVNPDGSTFQEEEPKATEASPTRPAVSAPKPAWVGYAVTVLGLPHDAAAAMTKQDLIDRANAADTENSDGGSEGDEDTEFGE